MTDELYDDFATERAQVKQVFQYLQLEDAAKRRYTEADALNLANASRYYVDPSPELAAAIAETGTPWDDPMLNEIMFADKAEQESSWWDRVKSGIGAITRPLDLAVEGVWEEGFSRLQRTAVRAYQDDTDQSLLQSWRQAGPSDAVIAGSQVLQGQSPNIGTGLVANSTLAHETPGFGKKVAEGTQAAIESGTTPEAAFQSSLDQEQQDVYGDIGQPITYQAQAVRESTKIHFGDRQSSWSLGRAAAIRVADPQSALFNTISGAIDGTARVAFDPINAPADELTLAWRARNAVIPDAVTNLGDVGLISGKRPYLRPKTFTEWAENTARGRDSIETFVNVDNFADMNKIAPDLPLKVQRKLVTATNRNQVQNILSPYIGTVVPDAPLVPMGQRVLGDVIEEGSSGVSHKTWDSISAWGRRIKAEGGDRVISAYNPKDAIPAFRAQLDTIGASADETNRVLLKVAQAEDNPALIREAYADMTQIMANRFTELGYDAEDARYIMNQFMKEQNDVKSYLHNQAGKPIELEGADTFELLLNDGTKMDIPISGAHLDSEFAEQMLILPNMRDVRRATSVPRAIADKAIHNRMGWDPRGLRAGRITQVLDTTQSVWRDFALLRMGWTTRVIAEEALRKRAAGYSHMIENPAQALIAAITDSKMTDVYGDSLDDLFKMKGLGASGFARDLRNEAMGGTRFNRARQSWKPEPTRRLVSTDRQGNEVWEWTDAGRSGIATEYIQLGNSVGGRKMAQLGIDEAFDWFKTDEGVEALAEISKRSTGGLTSKLVKFENTGPVVDDANLSRWLESIDARKAEMTGGDFVYRDHGDPTWRKSNGDEWIDNNPYAMNSEELRQALRDDKVAGYTKAKTKAERQELLLEHRGLPTPDELGDRQFVVTKKGDQALDDLLGDQGRIHGEMSRQEMMDLENQIPDLFEQGGFAPPAVVKNVNPELAARLEGMYENFVNTVFHGIMEVPTMAINRSPFAKTRYTEEMAKFSLWTDQKTYDEMLKWADSNGFKKEFLEIRARELKTRGLKGTATHNNLKAVDGPFTDLKQMDELAKAKAIEDSKDLFYDLAKKGNWADAMRFIAPFADAWQEVLRRWAKMLDPTGISDIALGSKAIAPGQRIRNWERVRQLGNEMNNQMDKEGGLFGEDAFGNRVFNFPAAGMLAPRLANSMRSTMNLNSMLFVDPSSPRGFMLPGAGPYMQFPASVVSPMLRKVVGAELTGRMNGFIFGDFQPEDLNTVEGIVEPFMPTWMRRTFDVWFDERQAKVYADEIVGTYSTMVISGDNKWGDESEDQAITTMKDAKTTGTWLGLIRIADSIFVPNPTSPTYQPGVIAEMAGDKDGDVWMSIAAIGNEYRQAREIFGDESVAREWIMEKYGIDPMNTVSKTRQIFDRPVGQEAYEKLKDNPQIAEYFRYTAMAFVPEGDDVELYLPSYRDQFSEGAREKVTPEMAIQMISRQKGMIEYTQMQDDYDNAKRQAEGIYGKGTKSNKRYQEQLSRWKYERTQDIATAYWAWGTDKDVAEAGTRPTYETLHDQLMNATVEGSVSEGIALDMNPEVVDFLRHVKTIEAQLDELSLDEGNKFDWWRKAGGVNPENRGRKDDLHRWYISALEFKIDTMTGENSRLSAQWMMERVFVPLVQDVEMTDTIQFEPVEPPPPSGEWVDEDERLGSTSELYEQGVGNG